MKKIIKIFIIVLATSILFGCSNKATDIQMYYTYKGTDIKIGDDLSTINLTDFPQEQIDTRDKSVKYYKNNDIGIATESKNNEEKIIRLFFISNKIETKEGIHIGSTVDDVKRTYGISEYKDFKIEIKKDGVILTFIIDNEEKVSLIAYIEEN